MASRRGLERILVHGIRAGAALVLLTPLIVTPATAYPFIVGKALYSRATIEVVFGLYVVLTALRPTYTPPWRSRLLLLLTASLAAAVAATVLGVSPRRSLWSDYVWMQGAIDAAHWFAFTVVIVATFRTARDWRTLLSVNAGVGALIALLAVAKSYAVDAPFFGNLPEHYYPRIATVFGNPLYLGAYMLVNAVVTCGLLMRSVLEWRRRPWVWLGRLLWAAAAALHLWAFTLAGSLGAFAGLVAAVGSLSGAYLFLVPGRAARGAGAAAVVLTAGVVLLLVVAAGYLPGRFIGSSVNPLLARINHLSTPSTLEYRLASWQAGLAGFAERPLLGWGPDNFRVVFGRHAAGADDSTIVYVAYAHSKLVEEAATKGLAGLLTYLATCGCALLIIVRAGRRAASGDRALMLFAGAALVGAFVQIQTLFTHSTSSLQYALLFGFTCFLEQRAPAAARPAARRRGGRVPASPCGRRVVRVSAALGALVLAGAGLAANRAIYSGAVELHRSYAAEHEEAVAQRAIDAFEPLANLPRLLWFLSLANRWPELHASDSAAAKATLDRAGVEAEAALAAEPENWRIHQALAVLYRAAASTAPEYGAVAERFLRQALELAPNLYRFAPSGW